MGIFNRWFGGKKNAGESPAPKIKQPQFVRKYNEKGQGGDATYETYKGTDAESAKAFLITKRVDKPMYYVIVDTPEGNWGMDVQGLYLERLFPWQTNVGSAECEGHIIPMSWSQFGLGMAAKKFNDNFVVKVQCGKCEYQWLDGIRYQNITVVRCPKCKGLNKIDSSNIQVYLV